MNRLRSSVLLLCLAQVVTTSNLLRASDAPGEKLLPKETLVFFTIADVPEFRQKWDKSSVGQMLHDPQLKPFLDDVEKNIIEASKKMENETGVSISDLMELPQGELTVALMEKPARKLSFVFMLEFGKNKATIEKLLKKMDEALDKEAAEHTTEEIEKVAVHVYTLKNPEPDNPLKTITYFTDESFLVFSTEIEALKEVIERWEGNSDDSLAQNDQFKYIQSQCKLESGESLVKWYVNPIGLIQSGITMAQETIPQAGLAAAFLPMFGVDGWKGWGGTLDFDEGEFEGVSNSFIFAENPKGLMGVFLFPAAQLVPPKWVPADIGSYYAANWNIAGAYTSIETLVDSFQGRGATGRVLDQIAEQGPMVHAKKDLIDHLDGKIHILQSEAKDTDDDAPPTPQVLAAFGLKDAAKIKKTLAAAAKSAASNLEAREFNGETIYEIFTPNSDQSVSIAVTEGQMVITNDTPLLEGMMRGQAGGRAALIDSSEYKRISKFFPSKTSMMSFQRSEAQFKTYYNLLRKSDNIWDGVDVSKLPRFEAISKYFQPSGSYTIPDKKGAKSVAYSLKRSE
jgi:hypothetical protein